MHKISKTFVFIILNTFLFHFSWAQLHEEVSFPSMDGLVITADFHTVDKNAPTIMMFHQSVSSRGEYRDIAPKLLSQGFNCIAVDLRWGKKDFWNKVYNETARRNNTYVIVENYEDTEEYQLNKVWPEIFNAYFDMEATLKYLNDKGYKGEKIVMGSSFSAMLAFKLANDYDDEIKGVLAFSPGEYHPTQDSLLYSWSRSVKAPVYISAGKGVEEYNMTQSIYSDLPQTKIKKFHQSKGRHGASVLISQEEDWEPLYEFLKIYESKNKNIGFRIIEFGRTDDKQGDSIERKTKIIPVSLWYPTSQSPSETMIKMCYKDYVRKIKKEKSFLENRALFMRILNNYGEIDSTKKDDLVKHFLNTEIPVFNSPKYPERQYPVVVICGANPIYHTYLAEMIAKNGFIVASIPRLGIKEGERLPFNQQGSAEFRNDLEFIISSLSQFNFVDKTKLSLIAWSFEGIPVLETALSNHSTNLFISFDSSIGYEYGNDLITDSAAVYGQRTEFPLLHFTSSSMDYGKDLELLDKLKILNNNVNVNNTFELTHSEFTAISSIAIKEINKGDVNSIYDLLITIVVNKLRETTANN